MDDWLTVGEIERQTRIPERTLRRYLELHGHHLQTRRQGRRVLVAESVISILQQIREWYEAGWNAERIEGALSESGLQVTVAVDGHDMAMTATEALQTLQQSLATAMTAIATEMALCGRKWRKAAKKRNNCDASLMITWTPETIS